MPLSEDAKEGRWAKRARSIQTKVHKKDLMNYFAEVWIPTGLLEKCGRRLLPKLVNDNKLLQFYLMFLKYWECFTN